MRVIRAQGRQHVQRNYIAFHSWVERTKKEPTQAPSSASSTIVVFRQVDFKVFDFTKYRFSKCRFSKFRFSKIRISKIDFQKFDIQKIDFKHFDFQKFAFQKIDFQNSLSLLILNGPITSPKHPFLPYPLPVGPKWSPYVAEASLTNRGAGRHEFVPLQRHEFV